MNFIVLLFTFSNSFLLKFIPNYQLNGLNYRRTFIDRKSMQPLFGRTKIIDNSLVLDDFEDIVSALSSFRQIYGNFKIPIGFEVPKDSDWPTNTHGLRLGKRLKMILSKEIFFKKYPENVQRLVNIGFVPSNYLFLDEFDLTVWAIRQYKSLYNSLDIQRNFIVPKDTDWPKILWEFELGSFSYKIRTNGVPADKIEKLQELEQIGFELKSDDSKVAVRPKRSTSKSEEAIFLKLIEALKLYYSLYGVNSSIPKDFVIPTTSDWPLVLHGFTLGDLIADLTNDFRFISGSEENLRRLYNVGFSWATYVPEYSNISNCSFDLVIEGILYYKKVYSSTSIPDDFIIDSSWPEKFWKLELGREINKIREKPILKRNIIVR
jgi:hypothetical protein